MQGRVEAIAAAARRRGRQRIVAAGGAGKTFLLDHVAAAVGGSIVRWSAAVDPDAVPPAGGMLLADDVHLAHEHALKDLVDRAHGVVAAHRPVRGRAGVLLDALASEPHVLVPFDHDILRDVLAARWGRPPDPALVERVLALTGGVPRFALAIAGAEPVAGPQAGAAAALHEAVRAELRRLGPEGTALVRAAALLDGVDPPLVAAAAALDPHEAAVAMEQLIASGLAIGLHIRLVPVVADVVRQSTSDAEAAAVGERVAAAALQDGHDMTAVADRLQTLPAIGPRAARCLLTAARLKLDDAPNRAHAWVEAATRDGIVPADLAAMRALISFRQGHVTDTVTAVDELLRADPHWATDDVHREAVETAAAVLGAQGAWARSAHLAEAVTAAGDSAVALATLGWLAAGDATAVRRVMRTYEASAPPDLRTAGALAIARALVMSLSNEPARALPLLLEAAQLTQLAAPRVPLPETPHALAAVVACHLWEFDVAAQVLSDSGAPDPRPPARWRSPSPMRGDAADRRWELLSAWVALRRGDWAGSLAIVEQVRAGARVLEPRDALLADAVEAGVARRQGDLDTMTQVWRRARTLLLRRLPDMLSLQPAGELLIVGARLKDRGTVRSSLMGLRELIARAGLPPLWALSLLWDELHIQIALDDHDAARAAVKLADALARPGTRAEAVTSAAICWTDALTADADPARVRAAASGLADTGLAWEAARLTGAAAIRAADSAQMRELLMFARDLSARQVSAVQEPASELSPRERDVAVHLLSGLTHREIGGLLFIAPKTVEHHVARIRRKLGAGSRAELLVALRRHLPDVDG